MKKRRNRIYRRIAVALTVALLAGQSQTLVLAEEGDAPQTEISAEKTDTDISDSGSETGDGNNDGAENQSPEDNENNGDQQGDGDEQGKCVCDTKCAEDSVNTDCPVCAADFGACAGKEGDAGNNDTENNDTENNEQETAKNAGGGVNPAEEELSEEVLDENAGIAALAEEGVEAYAGSPLLFDYTDPESNKTLQYRWESDSGTVTVAENPGVSGDLTIPESVVYDGVAYCVTSIGERAFEKCSGLTSVTIPEGVTSIEDYAFRGCSSLGSVEIPGSVISIGYLAFSGCSSLSSVIIPESVTRIEDGAFYECSSLSSVEIPGSVTSIEYGTFSGCSSLSSVTIPKSVTSIGIGAFKGCSSLSSVEIPENMIRIENYTFHGCSSLSSVEIPGNVTSIGERAFYGCKNLTTLKVLTAVPPQTEADAFIGDRPDKRNLEFWNADGTKKLTGDDWNNARNTYLSYNDGDTSDNLWYGWLIEESSPEEPTTYAVTIRVNLDGSPWDNHGKTFALLPDSGDFLEVSVTPEAGTYKISGVSNGTYSIYDITGVSPDTLSSGARAAGMDTGVDVTVQDGNAEATVNYYTATFYDRDADDKAVAYENDTDQRQQIVLGGQKVTTPITNPAEPKDPGKAGYVFDGWKTEDGTAYDFGAAVGGKQEIYASWREAGTPPTQHTITVIKETEGGSVSPSGPSVRVNEGGSVRFVITPDAGYRIKSVTVDGTDRTAELADAPGGGKSYTFINVTSNHSIRVEFEKDGNGGGDNPDPNPNPNPNPDPDGGNGGGGGDDDDDNKKPGGGNGGGSGEGGNNNPGGDNGGGNGDSSDGGNSQTTVGTQAASGAAGISAGGNAVSGNNQAVSGSTSSASSQTAGGTGTSANGKEPKTGDASYLQVYATLAMIAGLTYLLLYVLEESRGMSEREKEAFVAAFIRWGKKGGAFRKCCAVAAIFCLLAYYHIIGKNVGGNTLRDKYLGQAF